MYRHTMEQCYYSPENYTWTVKARVSIAYLQRKFDVTQSNYLTYIFLENDSIYIRFGIKNEIFIL